MLVKFLPAEERFFFFIFLFRRCYFRPPKSAIFGRNEPGQLRRADLGPRGPDFRAPAAPRAPPHARTRAARGAAGRPRYRRRGSTRLGPPSSQPPSHIMFRRVPSHRPREVHRGVGEGPTEVVWPGSELGLAVSHKFRVFCEFAHFIAI